MISIETCYLKVTNLKKDDLYYVPLELAVTLSKEDSKN